MARRHPEPNIDGFITGDRVVFSIPNFGLTGEVVRVYPMRIEVRADDTDRIYNIISCDATRIATGV